MLERLNHPGTIIIVGRQHSGTRILPETMKNSGVFLGEPLNIASDLLPPEKLYQACRIFGKHVVYKGNHNWSFQKAVATKIPDHFKNLLEQYLTSIINTNHPKRGWKIPENTLLYPWLVRLLPKANFIFWVRHPEGSCAKMTGVDRLEKWNIPCKKFLMHQWNYKIRVVSWKYHYDIVKQTPQPENFTRIRFEDYVLDQDFYKKQLADKLGLSGLRTIQLDKTKVGPFSKKLRRKYPFLIPAMDELQYK